MRRGVVLPVSVTALVPALRQPVHFLMMSSSDGDLGGENDVTGNQESKYERDSLLILYHIITYSICQITRR